MSETKIPRPVKGYVKAALKLQELERKADEAREELKRRRLKMTGGQLGTAERLLKHDADTLRLLEIPCGKDQARASCRGGTKHDAVPLP